MNKTILGLVLAVFAVFGCGDGYETDEGLGEVEQAVEITTSAKGTWGVRTGANRNTCDLNVSSGTGCHFVGSWADQVQNDQMIFKIGVDFSTRWEWETEVNNAVDEFCTLLQSNMNSPTPPHSNWTCYRVAAGQGNIRVTPSSRSAALNGNIENFGALSFVGTGISMAELNGNVPGKFYNHSGGDVTFDPTVITSYATGQGYSLTQRAYARKRVLWHYLLAAMGLGGQSYQTTAASYYKLHTSSPFVVTNDERCRGRNINWLSQEAFEIEAITGC